MIYFNDNHVRIHLGSLCNVVEHLKLVCYSKITKWHRFLSLEAHDHIQTDHIDIKGVLNNNNIIIMAGMAVV